VSINELNAEDELLVEQLLKIPGKVFRGFTWDETKSANKNDILKQLKNCFKNIKEISIGPMCFTDYAVILIEGDGQPEDLTFAFRVAKKDYNNIYEYLESYEQFTRVSAEEADTIFAVYKKRGE
jgi:hypothetical protein